MEPYTKAGTAEASVAATVPEAHWEAGRYPQGAVHPQTLAPRLIIQGATLRNPAEAAKPFARPTA